LEKLQTHCVDAPLEGILGLLGLSFPPDFGVGIVEFEEIAEAERVDEEVVSMFLVFPHSLERGNNRDRNPVVLRVFLIEGPHEPSVMRFISACKFVGCVKTYLS